MEQTLKNSNESKEKSKKHEWWMVALRLEDYESENAAEEHYQRWKGKLP